MNEDSDLAVEIVEEQVAERVWQLNSRTSVVDAIMYLRSIVGTEFDEIFHQIARRAGDNLKVSTLPVIE